MIFFFTIFKWFSDPYHSEWKETYVNVLKCLDSQSATTLHKNSSSLLENIQF